MATYVQINKFGVKDIFDAKYKSQAIAEMQKLAAQVLKAKKDSLSVDVPKEKGAKGWTIDATLVSLAPDKAGKKLLGNVSMVISTWPGKSVKAMPNGSTALPIDSADKIDAGDVTAVAGGAAKGAMEAAVKYMLATKP